MGCGESKDASAAAPRKPAAPPEPKYQAPEVIPAPKPAVVPQPAAAVAASVPTPMSPASMPKRQNQAIYATSTDRRIQEVEFFRNVVKRTEE